MLFAKAVRLRARTTSAAFEMHLGGADDITYLIRKSRRFIMSSTNEIIVPASMPLRLRRALYRATHRGTKELDWLVGRFAEAHAPAMTDAELGRFEIFLTVQDPDIHDWIMNPGLIPPVEFAGIIAGIRAFHGLSD